MGSPRLYSLRELARALGLPESTVRYYRDQFAAHIPSTGNGRGRRYPARTLKVLRTIAQGYACHESRETIERRLANARNEMQRWSEYDYVIVNDDLDESFRALQAILTAERLKRTRRTGLPGFVDGLLAEAERGA